MNKQKRNRKVLFDLNHPADFHFFKNLILRMQNQDYTLKVVARDKDCLHMLLDDAGIPYQSRGRGSHSLLGKYLFAMLILGRLFLQMLIFRPGMTLSLSSPYLALLSRFMGIPCVTFDDTDDNPRLLPLIRLSHYLVSPATYPHLFHQNHFRLPLFKELAYLHPTHFKMANKSSDIFFRITRTDSVHHTAASKLDLNLVMAKIHRIYLKYSIILSSEVHITPVDQATLRQANLTQIHNDLASCKVFWGNSATMAAEAAVMGIPSVFVGAEKFAYIRELEDYGLLYHYQPEELDLSFEKLTSLMNNDPPQDHFWNLRRQLLQEKIDTTSFLAWFVETLPESARILQEDPQYVRKFIAVNTH